METSKFWDAYHRAVSCTDWYADAELCAEALYFATGSLLQASAQPRASDCVLHIGCGSSTLGDFLESGRRGDGTSTASEGGIGVVVNVDFSEPVILEQRRRRPASIYEVCDVRDRDSLGEVVARAIAAEGIDLVVDKGTFDSLLQKESCAESRDDAFRCLSNLVQCLSKDVATRDASGTVAILSIIEPQKRWPFFQWALRSLLGGSLQPTEGSCGSLCAHRGGTGGEIDDFHATSASVSRERSVARDDCREATTAVEATCDCDEKEVCRETRCPADSSIAASGGAGSSSSPALAVLRHRCHLASRDSEAQCQLFAVEIQRPPLELPSQKSWYLYLLRFDKIAL